MAKKAKTIFVCQECGYESPKWMGQCVCGAWNSFVEEKVVEFNENDNRRRGSSVKAAMNGGQPGAAPSRVVKPTRLTEVKTSDYSRIHALEKEMQPTPGFLPGESQGQGSLVGCRL